MGAKNTPLIWLIFKVLPYLSCGSKHNDALLGSNFTRNITQFRNFERGKYNELQRITSIVAPKLTYRTTNGCFSERKTPILTHRPNTKSLFDRL